MKIGYARVSTKEQCIKMQVEALDSFGCEKIFKDVASGAKSERSGLEKAMENLRPGDQFVVWRMDRLGRSMRHLIETVQNFEEMGVEFVSLTEKMDTSTPGGKLIFHIFGAFAEFERNLIRERTMAGLKSAKARGKLGGRPSKITEEQAEMLFRLYRDPENSIDTICQMFRVSRTTLYNHLRRYQEEKVKDLSEKGLSDIEICKQVALTPKQLRDMRR